MPHQWSRRGNSMCQSSNYHHSHTQGCLQKGQCMQMLGEVFWSLTNSNHMLSNLEEWELKCGVFATVVAMVVQGMSLYNMVLIDMNLGKWPIYATYITHPITTYTFAVHNTAQCIQEGTHKCWCWRCMSHHSHRSRLDWRGRRTVLEVITTMNQLLQEVVH